MPLDKKTFRESKTVRVVIFIGFLAAVTALFPRNKISSLSYEVGSVWLQDDVTAPFTFPVYKKEEVYEQEKKAARESVYPVFRKSEKEFVPQEFQRYFDNLLTFLGIELGRAAANKKAPAIDSSLLRLADSLFAAMGLTPQEKALLLSEYKRVLKTRSEQQSLLGLYRTLLPSLIISIRSDGILNVPRREFSTEKFVIRAANDREESAVAFKSVRDSVEAVLTLGELLVERLRRPLESDTVQVALKLSLPFLAPNLLFDAAQTLADKVRAESSVPIADGIVRENEKVISRGEVITDLTKRKLDSYIRAKAEREVRTGELRLYIGKLLIVLIISSLFAAYLYFSRPQIFFDNTLLLLLVSVILLELLAAWYSVQLTWLSPYIVPIGLASILLTILFDSRTGIFATVTISLLAATIRGNDFSFALATLFAGGMGVFFTRDIRRRAQVALSVLYVFLGYAVAILAFNFSRLASFEEILNDLKFAAISSLLCFLVYPALLLIEKVFGITTDLTLLELSDANHPLLREMAANAPGTYTHTMQVSLLAEEAANRIGANALLCRVGAYFHDIGKLPQAQYFAENQGAHNPHDELTAITSGRIIGDHVKQGIELGRAYKLPQRVLDFIPQHHGTTMIHFFYDKALKFFPPDKLNPEDFRYPGPKPQSREAAIVMLADGVEASVRSLTTANEETIAQIIDTVIRKRLDEDQFSECPLTFAELKAIKESFIKTIIALRHKRVKYPGQKI
ncbi:MAG: HDIG domain-containing protein [Chloroherpetonaceae bacterium]|nr:HDIG domain-containing protein [Chloroherpetonaceae bacterium]MCS7210667.1 HDIG domain-containing protein [Chloroherpetonaceae bacterium]MDW8020932.1 HDIG domain-containing protein [Chloroherpetonaceae bacterium]